ncbi:MAG TPA: alpha/beta hydrolase [Candidatus Saccharimonadales bacterium]|nr:alpha/beta hydrolase [Candidatus Saccharimonadales bacterium]
MSLIKTRSYELTTYENGNPDADRFAIVLPGRLESKDYIHIKSHVDTLAALGFHAVAFDPPGSWESPGSIDSYTVANYLGAVNELIEYYGNKPTVIVGHSLGGSVAILAGANNPYIMAYVALMSLVGGSGTREDPEWKADGKVVFYRDIPPGDHHTAEQKHYDLPYSFFEDALTHDTKAALRNCRKPKLFILGKHDTQNAPSYPPEDYALIAEPKQLIEIDSPHSYRYHQAIINNVNAHIEIFVRSLPSIK